MTIGVLLATSFVACSCRDYRLCNRRVHHGWLFHRAPHPLFYASPFSPAWVWFKAQNFAAIPVLNTTATDRAHANGAVAQMGNLGNTFGTPIALGMIGVMGFGGLIAFTLAAYMLGIAAHIILGKMRN